MYEDEAIIHTIEIDSNIEVKLKIPEKLDVITFTAILQKANKLIKMGEVQIEKRQYTKRTLINNGRQKWTNELKEQLLNEYEKATDTELKTRLAHKYGMKNLTSIQNKVYNIRQERMIRINKLSEDGRMPYEIKKKYIGRNSNYNVETAKKLEKLIKEGNLSMREIAKKVGVTKSSIYYLVRNHLGKSVEEIRKEAGINGY